MAAVHLEHTPWAQKEEEEEEEEEDPYNNITKSFIFGLYFRPT